MMAVNGIGTGKIALVTGASRGIGRAVAKRLASDGALVAVHYGSNRAMAEEVVREIESEGGQAFPVGASFDKVNGVRTLYEELDAKLIERTGDNRFDVLVNNAGIGQSGAIEEVTEHSFDQVTSINVKAPLFVIQHGLNRMRDGGRIINLSSAVTRIAFPSLLEYSMSKGAINTLTMILAKQLGSRGITVNAIMPGIVETDMNAETLANPDGRSFAAGLSVFGRWGQPADIADAAAFLASSDSRWVTGQLLDGSGGTGL